MEGKNTLVHVTKYTCCGLCCHGISQLYHSEIGLSVRPRAFGPLSYNLSPRDVPYVLKSIVDTFRASTS